MRESPSPAAHRRWPRVDRHHEVDVRRLVLLTVFVLGPVGLSAEPTATLRPETAYHHVKSKLDGSDPWQVTTYVSSATRLDVLKWGPGTGEVVEVTADLDRTRSGPTDQRSSAGRVSSR